jgi:ABC-type transporter Mla MlaB component
MLMIAIREVSDRRATLALAGDVVGAWVEELRGACDRFLATGAALGLDLGEVGFIDRAGLALFRELHARGVRVRRCSPFVAEQLRDIAAC